MLRCTIFNHVVSFCRKLFPLSNNRVKTPCFEGQDKKNNDYTNATIIPQEQHSISKNKINKNALKVLTKLHQHGYEAYLVGGCIRDLLLNQPPKDFDVATNATPEQVKRVFTNCYLVGRRFRLAHIRFGREIIEVATFRGEHLSQESHIVKNSNISKRSQSGMLLRDNVYGTIEQDAKRRDFTLNSLYYDIENETIIDFHNGINDLKNGIIRLIGDAKTRYQEDPVRMLRAIRFAAKLKMTIEAKTASPIKELAPLLKNIPAARLFDESLKLLQSGNGHQTYLLLKEYQLFEPLFPSLTNLFISKNGHSNKSSRLEQMVEQVLKNTDLRIRNGKKVNPAFLFAGFLWYPMVEHAQELVQESGLTYHDAFALSINNILSEQCTAITIPHRFTATISEIWRLQLRFNKPSRKRIYSVFEHTKFRAAFDLLELRASIEKGELLSIAKWWETFQYADHDSKEQMIIEFVAQFNQHRRPKYKKRH